MPKEKQAKIWERDDLDWYVEPEWCSALLFEVEKFVGGVWDPACGQGNICRSALAAGIDAAGTDVVFRGERDPSWGRWFCQIGDFFGAWNGPVRPNIVTNPPFFRAAGTEQFIRTALALVPGKVAVFASLPFLASQKRSCGLFAEHPPARVWILGERPSCPPGEYLTAGNKAIGGTEDWLWIVWDNTAPIAETRLGWLKRTTK